MEVKRKLWFKTLALLLAFVMVIQILPMSAFAEEIKRETEGFVSNEQTLDIVDEVVDERTEYKKVYALSDGTFYEISSPVPIHENVNGEWIEPEINKDEPKTTSDVIEWCDELSENINKSPNDEYSISPANIDISESETSESRTVTHKIFGENTSVSTNILNKTSILVAQFPVTSLKDYYNTQATINCNIFVSAKCTKSVNIYAHNLNAKIDLNSSNLEKDDIENVMDAGILDFAAIKSSSDYAFDITDSYMKWEKGLLENNGIAFTTTAANNITIYDCYIARQYRIFDSYDADYSYHTIDMGRAGKVYINDYTNTVLLARDEIGIEGNIMPVELVRYFDLGHNSTYNSSGHSAWWNYGSYLQEITTYNYKWQAPDGSSIYFIPDPSKNTNGNYKYWIDVDNDGYKLELDTTQRNKFSNAKLVTPENYTYIFGEGGKITSITDEYDNTIKIQYTSEDTSQTNIYYVQDGLQRRYYFTYGDINPDDTSSNEEVLKSISIRTKGTTGSYADIEVDGKKATISYEYIVLPNGNVALSKVTYPDNEVVTYSYSNGQLTTITDTDGRKLTLNYEKEISDDETLNIYPSLVSYDEEVVNIDDDKFGEYLLKSSLDIDNHNSYQRVFQNTVGEKETIHYNQNLRIMYYSSPENTFYADYSKNQYGKEYLSQIVSPEDGCNEILNYDFEEGTNYWNDDQGEIVKKTLSGNGNYVLRINGATDTKRIVYQDVENYAKKGDIFVVGGWGEANTPIPTASHFWGIEIHTFSEDDEGNEIDNTIYSLAFDSTIDNEPQYRLGAFEVPEDAEYLEVQLVYSHQDGYADFDEIQLYKSSEENVSFFNEESEETASCNADIETDDSMDDTKTVYNSKGLITAKITSDGSLSMVNKYEYDEDYYLSNATDTNDVTTEYSYNAENGMLESTTIGDKTTNYLYTATGALKEVSRAVSGLTNSLENMNTKYSYSHDRITSVSHNGIKYNFTYNSFGNVKKVDLENISDLISYKYSNDYKQNLNSIEYANGNILGYEYNDNNNVIAIYFSSDSEAEPELIYKYEYDDKNNLIKITDNSTNRTIEYTDDGYTITGQIFNENGESEPGVIYSVSTDSSGVRHETLFGKEYVYTENESTYDEKSKETSYSSQYKFNVENYIINMNSVSISDYFGRIKSASMQISSPEIDGKIGGTGTHSIQNTYTYKNYDTSYSENGKEISVSATSNLIDSFKTEVVTKAVNNETGEQFEEVANLFISSYEYDNFGRITHVYYTQNVDEKVLAYYYEYDKSGQVTIDADLLNSKVTKYLYDSSGNIISKEIYEGKTFRFENDILTLSDIPTDTVNYEYGNTNESVLDGFSDLLTSYDGREITYDANGNPLNYSGTNLSGEDTDFKLGWEGSQLKSVMSTDGNTKYIYSYDQNGLRTKKTAYSSSNEIESEIEYIWEDNLLSGYRITYYNEDGPGYMVLKMLYDEYQSPIGLALHINGDIADNSDSGSNNLFTSNDNVYWFIKDGQGNVVAMYSELDNLTLGCNYDAYGNLTLDMSGTFIDNVQAQMDKAIRENPKLAPLIILLLGIAVAVAMSVVISMDQTTYRGYIFDPETGLYYCQNRYYSPTWGRFINMDDPSQLTQNIEEPLNANLYTYCYNDPVNNIDPTGESSYSLTGVGLQAEMSASLLSFVGEVGLELVYVWSKNALYPYYYYGGGAGAGYTNKAINYFKNSLKHISMSPKVSLKNIANLFKLNYSISIGFFGAFTNKSFAWPNSYANGYTTSNSISIGKFKGYKSTSSGCKVYGICYSPIGNSGFAFSKTTAKYKKITFNSSVIKSYLKAQKNTIKNAVR